MLVTIVQPLYSNVYIYPLGMGINIDHTFCYTVAQHGQHEFYTDHGCLGHSHECKTVGMGSAPSITALYHTGYVSI